MCRHLSCAVLPPGALPLESRLLAEPLQSFHSLEEHLGNKIFFFALSTGRSLRVTCHSDGGRAIAPFTLLEKGAQARGRVEGNACSRQPSASFDRINDTAWRLKYGQLGNFPCSKHLLHHLTRHPYPNLCTTLCPPTSRARVQFIV